MSRSGTTGRTVEESGRSSGRADYGVAAPGGPSGHQSHLGAGPAGGTTQPGCDASRAMPVPHSRPRAPFSPPFPRVGSRQPAMTPLT
jgi:hypothetical protein